jgi:hypothetical protein
MVSRLMRSVCDREIKQRSQRSVSGWVTKNLLSRACFKRHVKAFTVNANPHWVWLVNACTPAVGTLIG